MVIGVGMITVECKSPHLNAEWHDLLLVNPRLVMLSLLWADVVKRPLVITEIYRTEAMQRRYYPTNPTSKSVHQYWRGIDISLRGVDMAVAKIKAGHFNRLYPYDVNRPSLSTFLIHDIGLGTHLHVQTMDGGADEDKSVV